MIKKYSVLAIFLTLLSVFTGCENMVSDVDAPEAAEKLVVTSFISPDMPSINVNVFRSRPLYSRTINSGEYPAARKAQVIISNGTSSVTIPFDEEFNCFRIRQTEMEIIRGNTYKITVRDGELSAYAECKVPSFPLPEIEVVSVDSTLDNDFGQLLYHVNLRFKDSVGQGQFYHVTASSIYTDEFGSNPTLYELGFSRGEPYLSDKNKDGNYFTFTTNDIYPSGNKKLQLIFTIGITDENYYKYHKAVSGFEGDNPFSEPSPMYSNVQGGLGVFAAYIQQVSTFEY